ncbi:flagellar biosynthetic protein FliR [Zobellella denitrificans]|jgi:flagellar biosynthetic protein FliR|uniref:Flagellar biosynthetic protein FliR n=1 Tax=Zobellella denitrificans TaxID=347534 RepID=A0A231MY27_9GAMM|nr:flagellar biosynthetic protein FliR [Zobellella denitrificans]ATG73207.1 flagellar biosynthesis protein FliR [Zobellella denitrificans]OXS15143.1 flagellar biosynthetic protein FliR [Zobellella denitrificans]
MNYTTEQILLWLASYLWPLCRIGGLMMTIIMFGAQLTPVLVRLLLALAITIAVAPVLPPMPDIALFSAAGFLVTAQQVLIGATLGLLSQFLVQTFVTAGQIIAMQTSLGFASMVDPLNGQSAPVVGQFYLMLGTLLFLALDGHLVMIEAIIRSFDTLPVSTGGLSVASWQSLASLLTLLFQAAVSMALAAIVAMLLINFSFGVMTRAAPQLNIFSVGFAVSMVCGLFIMWLTLGGFLNHFENQWLRLQLVMCDTLYLRCEEG